MSQLFLSEYISKSSESVSPYHEESPDSFSFSGELNNNSELLREGGEQNSHRCRQNCRPLSFVQTERFAFDEMSKMPLGHCFTVRELFAGVQLGFDRRRLSAAINGLRKGGFVRAVGARYEPRENGNAGLSTVWEKVKEVA